MANNTNGQHYVWFDTEFSTLDLDRALLLQVAVIVTSTDLRRIHAPEDDFNCFLRLAPDAPVDPWVAENLPDLVRRCRTEAAAGPADADRLLAAFLDRVLGQASPEIRFRPVIAGNSVHADWTIARRLLPGLLDRVHYRVLDVTSVKLEWLRWFKGAGFDKENPAQVRAFFPGATLEASFGPHDAYYDVQASIAELAYYRSQLRRVDPPAA